MDRAVQFLVCHGDALLFTWVFVEQAGLPIPTIPLLLAAGSLASAGRMNLAWSVTLALAASLMADSLWYQLGRWRGPNILRLLFWISPKPHLCVRRMKKAFHRQEAAALLIAKFIPGLNFAAPPLAGISGVSPLRFLLFDTLASVSWAGSYMSLGYIFRRELARVAAYCAEFGTIGILTVTAAAAAFIGFRLSKPSSGSLRAGKGAQAAHMRGTRQAASRAIGT